MVGDGWGEVEDDVYAYGGADMTTLAPGETTNPLTSAMTMKDISRAEFATLEEISVKIIGYAIGTEDGDTNPEQAWS